MREGVNLLGATTVDSGAVQPSEHLLAELQRERRFTLVAQGTAGRVPDKILRDQRARTDAAYQSLSDSVTSASVQLAADAPLQLRIDEALQSVEGLGAVRKEIDEGRTDRSKAADSYNQIIDVFYRMFDSVAALDDKEIAKDARAILSISRASEYLARMDALAAGALAKGEFTPSERTEFVQLTGFYRISLQQSAAQLTGEDAMAYDAWAKSRAVSQLRQLEQRLAQQGNAVTPPVTASEWRAATEAARVSLEKFITDGGDRLVDRAVPGAVGVVLRLVLAGGLGLIAVVASIVLSITTTRQLLAQLQKLRDAAHELSDERLPGVVERIGRGEEVDLAEEVPALDFGDDEIGQVGQAFNTVQRTAVSVAAEQAELRRSIRDILLSLARRTQGLVHRQLTVLDVMERRETDPEELKELFRLDHLAIRMRRNAENLIVLSGSSPARTWRRSVPMVDVVRGALAEVEDYTRVTLMPMGDVVLIGRAVGDVIHLLAELIENAVSFSPPYTSVQVSGQLVANGYVIEIEDRGLGMKPEDLDSANERIADPPEFRITGTARLGLYVVSQLAKRHDIQVVLKASPYGGTTVVVLLPQELVQLDPTPDPQQNGGRERLPRRASSVATAARPVTGENVRTLKSARRAADPAPPAVPAPTSPPNQAPGAAPDRGAAPRPAPRPTPVPSPAPEPVQDPEPRSEETPAEPEQKSVAEFTPSGLPLRVPQANLAPALRDETPTQPDLEEDDDERSPEEIRAMMGSFQSGTRLGRTEAAKMMDEQSGGES
ncbi:nitrate- and nitrite sensing domain-containing protein [Nonomuraea mesophila]|uniref:nitrate- and nitrite sensing domain-containing protein n=1 Tax=Nonomuraea mesophila TaxID=2530382 RepID=UPI001FE50E16|nr:nitrate- and nitrite sensing domain-containing protein [Nonomuraea mesophila]